MTDKTRILVADDEPGMRRSLCDWLSEDGYEVVAVPDGPTAIKEVQEGDWNILLVDLKMPGMDGLEVLGKVTKINRDLPVIIVTAYATVDTAVAAMKEGAHDYLVKPVDPEELSLMLKKIVERQNLEKEIRFLKKELTKQYQFEDIVGKSRAMQEVFQLIRTIAPMPSTVIIEGASGTGKELTARAIHNNSPRAKGPFVALACGALAENLQESELFGYEKGAFTGALTQKKGKLELAGGGTLFLDDVADLSPKTQVDLLRVIQEREIRRLGGDTPINVDVRVIAATNRDLKQLIQDGKFREDLFYRLNVIKVHLPPLRERKEDIPLLVNRFILKYNIECGKKVELLSGEAMRLLMSYDWPGNVRELENVVERAVVVSDGPIVQVQHVPKELAESKGNPAACADAGVGKDLSLDEMEKKHIRSVLDRTGGNIQEAAKLLGIHRVTLSKKLKRFRVT
ncbi:MAG: sigma-54 dependent transcriptional regulator [Planctomycetota bacterium]|nr:sigma-54 dependent transcriptional regulator [Planctomycetota bacterium]